jgi:hypothetical protein
VRSEGLDLVGPGGLLTDLEFKLILNLLSDNERRYSEVVSDRVEVVDVHQSVFVLHEALDAAGWRQEFRGEGSLDLTASETPRALLDRRHCKNKQDQPTLTCPSKRRKLSPAGWVRRDPAGLVGEGLTFAGRPAGVHLPFSENAKNVVLPFQPGIPRCV